MSRTETHVATQQRWLPAAVGVAAVLLAGCAAMQPRTPEEAVAERAQARWQALLSGDVETAYQYYSPGFRSSSSVQNLKQRLAAQRVRWTDAGFQEVRCEGEALCKAIFKVKFDYQVPVQGVGKVTRTTTVSEDWIETDGAWFYVPPNAPGSGLR